MSHSYYNKQWTDAQVVIGDLLPVELPTKPEPDRLAAFQFLATMYIKYIQAFRRLEHAYDQIVHPQKRRVLRLVLDGVMGRVLEIKNEMVNLELSEFHYFDDVLSDLKLTPNDVEMPIPKYFVVERGKALKEREKLLGQILSKLGNPEKDQLQEEVKLTVEEAVRLLQVHERARQGRLRAKFMLEIRMQEEREKKAANRGAPTLDADVAAARLQKLWKGFAQRRRTKRERDDEMVFIGMMPPPPLNPKTAPQTLALKAEAERRRVQDINEQEYQQAIIHTKEKIRETEGPDMKETLMDQIRQWFIECRDAQGRFPDYPTEEEGGSLLFFKERDPAEVAAELAAQEEEKAKKKGKKDGKPKKKEKKDKKDGKDGKGKKSKKEEEEDEGWKMAASNFVQPIKDATGTFKAVWAPRDETENFSQKHEVELIKEEKRKEVNEEIRLHVDELMRQELKNLKLAVDRDKGKKGKKGKGKKKGGKKGKGKKIKDLTPDRTIESLYEELVSEGVIVRPPKMSMVDYEGEYSYLGTTLRQANVEPQPSLSDVRRLVTEYCVLPLGSPMVHEQAPLIKSVMLAGPRGTGKKTLVYAVCAETGANLFDLTATNLAGKYPGKEGLKLLMHMIFKVGRALQPSIFYINDCERMFKKKVPKTDVTDPKRLKKELPKSLKTIKPEDRLLLLGVSSAPFDGEMKPMASTYQKIILVPRPDYASRNLLWRKIIMRHGGIITNTLDISSLTKISDGYTAGMMDQVCANVLNERRVQQLAKKALTAVEFVPPLSRLDPVYKEEEESYKVWYAKTPLGKKRAKAALGEEDDGGKGKGKKGDKKGAKGKKK